MSIKITIRKCEHCGHRYIYNISTGDLGIICPRCHRGQSKILPCSYIRAKRK